MNEAEFKQLITNFYENKTTFEKPRGGIFTITKIGKSKVGNEEFEAFQYSGQNKYIPFKTLYECSMHLDLTGSLTKEWFKNTFSVESNGRECNFTTIGSILVKLGKAYYKTLGIYEKS